MDWIIYALAALGAIALAVMAFVLLIWILMTLQERRQVESGREILNRKLEGAFQQLCHLCGSPMRRVRPDRDGVTTWMCTWSTCPGIRRVPPVGTVPKNRDEQVH